MSLQTRILNFELITELPLHHLPSLFPAVTPFAAARRRRRPKPLCAPGFRNTGSPLAAPVRDTHPRRCSARHAADIVAALDVRVHASLVEPPRRRSSCPHRFTTPNPSSPLPRIALEPELGLPRARERSRPPWPPPSPCTPCPHLRSSSNPTEPAVPSLTYHGTPELSPSPSPAPEAPPASMSAAAMVAAALLPRSSHLRSPFAQTEPGNRSTTSP